MISPIKGWSWTVAGDDVHLAGPAGHIRYTERRRPTLGLPELLAQADGLGFRVERLVTMKNLVTLEGEFGILAVFDGGFEGKRARRVFGVVFGDDFYALADGISLDADKWDALATTVEKLTKSDTHLLGVRRRRFPFVPPAGWREVRGLFHTHYFQGLATLLVCPAIPGAREDVEATLLEGTEPTAPPQEIRTPNGLSGVLHRTDGRIAALFEDGRYVYPILLDGPTDAAALDAFHVLIGTISPIPPPRYFEKRPAAAVGHWVD